MRPVKPRQKKIPTSPTPAIITQMFAAPPRPPASFIAALIAMLTIGACHRAAPKAPADPLADFALSVVAAARSPAGIGPDLVDAQLVESIRRLQLVAHTAADTHDPAELMRSYTGQSGPDRRYPPEDRPRMQRERATRGLLAMVDGPCAAESFEPARRGRVAFLTTPLPGDIPGEILRGQQEVADALRGSELARVRCTKGDVAMLTVKDERGRYRLVDMFPTVRSNIEVRPDEPSMK